MQLTPLPGLSLRDLADVQAASVDRSPGLHVTDIVRVILATVDPKRYGDGANARTFPEGARENWQEAGFIWEELLSRLFALRAAGRTGGGGGELRFRPGELSKDGIIGSPDGICLTDDGTVILEEYKATWKSSRGFDLYDKRYLWWLLQIQAYCTLAGATTARLYVFHVNGDYDAFIPAVAGYQLDFSERELADAWRALVNTAKSKGWIAA